MFDKLQEVEKRYQELEGLMSDPNLLGQQKEFSKLAKERSELEEIVTCFREWKKVEREIQENRVLLEENDEAMRELAKEELIVLRERKDNLEERLRVLILPKDPNDSKNVILEIRAGTGGDDRIPVTTVYPTRPGGRVKRSVGCPTGWYPASGQPFPGRVPCP